MLKLVDPANGNTPSLARYADDPRFTALVGELHSEARQVLPNVRGCVWMINSTATGGGVAEMLPGLIMLLRELGLRVNWAVIGSERPEFFALTKRIHNLLHGETSAGIALGPDDSRLLENVGQANAEGLLPHLGPDDILVVHDPQPVCLGKDLARRRGLRAIWRCHVGLDERNAATQAVWRFLRPHLDGYAAAAFSAPEYIPSFLAGRASVLHPGIDPLSHKSRDLTVSKMVGILVNAGIQTAHEPVPTPDFPVPVRRFVADGKLVTPGEIGLLFRPIVLQVSRWDRLKGWRPLLEAFVRLKARVRAGGASALSPRNQRRLELARLVLAGPDPAGVADDPEGAEVFRELCDAYQGLSPADREDVALLLLPMDSRKRNALIVNALQRCATVVVQNSLREGFGLTVTEAMWKRHAVLGTHAVGIRTQLRDRIDGLLTRDANNPEEIAANIEALLTAPRARYDMGGHAYRRVHERFLVFAQLSHYLSLFSRTLGIASGTGLAE
ncbi:MAG: glycosyltransferase [Deltaproteobacteria bacterium]|nr:glycosyltransferase [Deltaproteobacteria bacterium]